MKMFIILLILKILVLISGLVFDHFFANCLLEHFDLMFSSIEIMLLYQNLAHFAPVHLLMSILASSLGVN